MFSGDAPISFVAKGSEWDGSFVNSQEDVFVPGRYKCSDSEVESARRLNWERKEERQGERERGRERRKE